MVCHIITMTWTSQKVTGVLLISVLVFVLEQDDINGEVGSL